MVPFSTSRDIAELPVVILFKTLTTKLRKYKYDLVLLALV